MKKIRIIALFLSLVLAFSSILPIMSFAQDDEQATEETYTVAPYIFRTEGVGDNKVKVWLELSPVIAEGIAAYQIALQLTNREGVTVAGRKMDFAFDEALEEAKIKESKFDESTQIMNIYVAGTKNLVQTGIDENGNITNTLPIGTATVEALSLKAENPFKIVLSGNTGDLKTVGLDCTVSEAAKMYSTESEAFEIPVDGTIFAIPDYSLSVKKSGEGTVKAYKVDENGNKTLFEGSAIENTLVCVEVTPATGYYLSKIVLTDKVTGTSTELTGDVFNLTSDMEVSAVFEKQIINYNVTVKVSGNGTANAYKVEGGKETLITNGTAAAGTKVKVVAAPATGYKIAKVVLSVKSTGETKTLSGDYSFTVTADSEITVTFEKIPEEKPDDPVVITPENCTCNCHKTGFAGFIYKIERFFWKLFKINKVCVCNEPHY